MLDAHREPPTTARGAPAPGTAVRRRAARRTEPRATPRRHPRSCRADPPIPCARRRNVRQQLPHPNRSVQSLQHDLQRGYADRHEHHVEQRRRPRTRPRNGDRRRLRRSAHRGGRAVARGESWLGDPAADRAICRLRGRSARFRPEPVQDRRGRQHHRAVPGGRHRQLRRRGVGAVAARLHPSARTSCSAAPSTPSCGPATSDVGPFYCPVDQTAYFDTDFFEVLDAPSSVPAEARSRRSTSSPTSSAITCRTCRARSAAHSRAPQGPDGRRCAHRAAGRLLRGRLGTLRGDHQAGGHRRARSSSR